MIRNFSGQAHYSLRAALIGSVALSVVLLASPPGNAQSSEDAPIAEPASFLAEAVELQAEQWCRPVVHLAVDARPLVCWMHLTAEPTPGVPLDMVGMNFGDFPPWSTPDLAAISAEIERYEVRMAEQREADRKAAEQARRRQQPTQQTLPGGTPCGVRRGEILTPEQLACIHGTVPPAPEEYDDGYVEWDESMYDPNAPAEHDPDWGPVHGIFEPRPPAPSFDECPHGWRYDSDTGYRCL